MHAHTLLSKPTAVQNTAIAAQRNRDGSLETLESNPPGQDKQPNGDFVDRGCRIQSSTTYPTLLSESGHLLPANHVTARWAASPVLTMYYIPGPS